MKLALNLFLLVISIKSFGNIESNSIVAIVNENIITSQSIKTQLDQASSPSKKISLINDRIDLVLQLDLVKKYNLVPSQDEIEDAFKYISDKNSISIIELKKHPNFKFIENDVIQNLSLFNLKTFITRDLEVFISEEEIKEYCQNNGQNLKQIKIAEIVISQPPNLNPKDSNKDTEVKKFLEILKNHIAKGASFEKLAKLHSQDPTYLNGGISNWKLIDTPLLKLIDNLKKNEVSDIYKKNEGWAIAIKKEERMFNQNLENCKQEITQNKAQKYFEEYMDNIKKAAKIVIYEKNLKLN